MPLELKRPTDLLTETGRYKMKYITNQQLIVDITAMPAKMQEVGLLRNFI